MDRKKDLLKQKKSYIDYILLKIQEEDWHAISDAANDLREIEAGLTMLTEIKKSSLYKRVLKTKRK